MDCNATPARSPSINLLWLHVYKWPDTHNENSWDRSGRYSPVMLEKLVSDINE
jgi:hypothetical protein